MAVDLAARTLRWEELPSGTLYAYVLPDLGRMLYSGIFPAPVLPIMREVIKKPGDFGDHELTDDEARAWDEGRARVVAWMIRKVDAEDVSLTFEDVIDPERFPDDDFLSLWLRALRMIPAPKATEIPEMAKT